MHDVTRRACKMVLACVATSCLAGASEKQEVEKEVSRLASSAFREREETSLRIAGRLEALERRVRQGEDGDALAARAEFRTVMRTLREAARSKDLELGARAEALIAPFLKGAPLWQKDQDLPGVVRALLSTPRGILAGGGDDCDEDGWLGLFDADTGKTLWLRQALPGGVTLLREGPAGVFVGGSPDGEEMGWILRVDPATGKAAWEQPVILAEHQVTGLASTETGVLAVLWHPVPPGKSILACYDKDGNLVWRREDFPGPIRGTPQVVDGHVWVRGGIGQKPDEAWLQGLALRSGAPVDPGHAIPPGPTPRPEAPEWFSRVLRDVQDWKAVSSHFVTAGGCLVPDEAEGTEAAIDMGWLGVYRRQDADE